MGDVEVDLQSLANLTGDGKPTELVTDVLIIVNAILADPDCVQTDGSSRRGSGARTSTTSIACKTPACKYFIASHVNAK